MGCVFIAYPFLNLNLRTLSEFPETENHQLNHAFEIREVIVRPSLGNIGGPRSEHFRSSLDVHGDDVR